MNTQKIKIFVMLIFVGFAFTHCNEKQEELTELNFGGSLIGGGGQADVSKTAFRNTVYNITRQHCASCHTTQYPQHAASNYEDAHDVLVESGKVDFILTDKSSIYTKIKSQSHGCWGNCSENAEEMLEAINLWKEAIVSSSSAGSGSSIITEEEECIPVTIEIPATTSEDAFRDTLYAVTTQRCANCHGAAGSGGRYPNHGSSNLQEAHDNLVNDSINGVPLIDDANPANSFLVTKIANGHQGIATSVATDIQNAIVDWNSGKTSARSVASCKAGNGVVESNEPISDGVEVEASNGGEFFAADATLQNGMTLVGDYIQSPNNGQSFNGDNDIPDGARAKATWTVNFDQPGVYEVLGDVQGIDGGTDSFWIGIGNDYAEWHVGSIGAFRLVTVTHDNDMNRKTFIIENPGTYTLSANQREPRTMLKRLIVRPVGSEELGGVAAKVLTFDLSGITGRAGAILEMNFKVLDEYSYEVSNLTMKNAAGLYVKGLKIYINGRASSEYTTFNLVEKNITSNDEVISPYSVIMLKEFGENSDKIGIKFDIIQ
jgi:mono/diheme cytochrome c family protein